MDSVSTIGKKVRHIEALSEAQYMVERRMTNVSIQDNAGNMIEGRLARKQKLLLATR
jgi:hypothetical protein